MSYTTLKRGDKGKKVLLLQSKLNKIGAMLIPDGDFGRGTQRGVSFAQDIAGQEQTGIADDDLQIWLDSRPEPFEKLDTDGLAFIAKEETGGLSYYNNITRWPHFPGFKSGITIGVGYDLRFNSKEDFKENWGDHLSSEHIEELINDIGEKGSKERAKELKDKGIEIPFKSAWPVLIDLTIPRYYEMTESIYPSLESLSPLCRSVLVSLVFNRGSSLRGSKRKEMKEIQNILENANNANSKKERLEILENVEDEILSMQRLWSPSSGLVKRRQSEANLWRKGLKI